MVIDGCQVCATGDRRTVPGVMQGAGVISPGAVAVDARPPAPADAGRGDPAWTLLDEQDEWLEFSRPADAAEPGVWESTVVFEGMHCAACAGTIEQALRATPGVRAADVSAASHRGRVVWDESATQPSRWMNAVLRTGYRPLPAHDALATERRLAETRKMTWRLGVAGLCMMQVMMYATPTYFTAPGEIEPDLVNLLRWAQWVLSVPVVLFSCQPFFRNAWLDLKLRRVSMDLPVALGMLITFVVSSLGTFEPAGVFGREVYFDSLTMFVFFLLTGRWLELRLRDRTAGALEALMHRLPDSVQRRDAAGAWERVSVRRIRAGDVLQVLPGEAFPADGVLINGQTLADEALLTGESTPLARAAGERVIAGSHNLSAPVEMRVEQAGGDTRYAQIVALMAQAATSKPQIALLADRMAKPFLIFVLLAAGLACAWWWPSDPGHALMIAVAILVVTCPCALSLATPAAMLASAGALARNGVLVRRLQALEALSHVDTVVFDKTGTLTRDAFVLEDVRLREGVSRASALSTPAPHAALPLPPTTQPHLSDERGWLASFLLREDLRADSGAAVAELQAAGLKVSLLSGDRSESAARVGQLAGITDAQGGCLPDDKLAWMQQAQAAGHQVAMVGDGLNDGPVLAGANVSFAFGRAVPLARAQADFVVLGDRLSLIPITYAKAGRTMRVVRQNLGWAAAYNAVGVPLAMAGWMPAWAAGLGMAASSLLVVLNALRLSSSAEPPVTEVP